MKILPRARSRRLERLDAYVSTFLERDLPVLGLRRGFVVYTGDARRSVTPSIELVPWAAVARGEIDLPL